MWLPVSHSLSSISSVKRMTVKLKRAEYLMKPSLKTHAEVLVLSHSGVVRQQAHVICECNACAQLVYYAFLKCSRKSRPGLVVNVDIK